MKSPVPIDFAQQADVFALLFEQLGMKPGLGR